MIELLVVIAIIAILAGLLLPTLAAAKERSRRAQCQSNMHQVSLGALMYAMDNKNLFPSDEFEGTYRDSWLSLSTYNYFTVAMKIGTNCLACPNRADYYATNALQVRVGYYCDWAMPTAYDTRPRGENYGTSFWPWDSPQKSTDVTPYTYLMSDILEAGTEFYQNLSQVTSAPHTANGGKVSGQNVIEDPAKLGSEGINVCQIDGSVQWKPELLVHKRFVWYYCEGTDCDPNGEIIGYF